MELDSKHKIETGEMMSDMKIYGFASFEDEKEANKLLESDFPFHIQKKQSTRLNWEGEYPIEFFVIPDKEKLKNCPLSIQEIVTKFKDVFEDIFDYSNGQVFLEFQQGDETCALITYSDMGGNYICDRNSKHFYTTGQVAELTEEEEDEYANFDYTRENLQIPNHWENVYDEGMETD